MQPQIFRHSALILVIGLVLLALAVSRGADGSPLASRTSASTLTALPGTPAPDAPRILVRPAAEPIEKPEPIVIEAAPRPEPSPAESTRRAQPGRAPAAPAPAPAPAPRPAPQPRPEGLAELIPALIDGVLRVLPYIGH